MKFYLLIAAYLVLINTLTYRAFAQDKRAAIKRRKRTPEARLLMWALIGGFAGAKYAQSRLRHKTHKQPFGRRLNMMGIVLAVVAVVLISGPFVQP